VLSWRRRRGGLRPVFLLLFALATAVLSYVFFERSVAGSMWVIAEARTRAIVVELAGECVMETMEGIRYENLMRVSLDENGRVSLLQPDTVVLTRLISRMTVNIQRGLDDAGPVDFDIPMGMIVGSNLFANWGPNIPVSMMSVGTVSCDVRDRFEACGLNQTRHVIFAVVTARVRIAVPLSAQRIEVVTEVPMADAVIVGPVPQVYLDLGDGLGGGGARGPGD